MLIWPQKGKEAKGGRFVLFCFRDYIYHIGFLRFPFRVSVADERADDRSSYSLSYY